MKKTIILISMRVAAAGLLRAGWFYQENLRGSAPACKPPPQDITGLLEAAPPPSPAAPKPHLALTAPLPSYIDLPAHSAPLGRPVNILLADDGVMVILDDTAGVIY